MPKTLVKISKTGEVSYIYTDELVGLLSQGEASIRRVSHVEPTTDGQWTAQMEDGTLLGPYKLRSTALVEEVKYLEEKYFKGGKSVEQSSAP